MKDWNILTQHYRNMNKRKWQNKPTYAATSPDNAEWWKAQYKCRAESEWKSWRIAANSNQSPALRAALDAVERGEL